MTAAHRDNADLTRFRAASLGLAGRDRRVMSPSVPGRIHSWSAGARGVIEPRWEPVPRLPAGIAVTAARHCHPRSWRRSASRRYLIRMSGTDFYYTPQVRLAEQLARL